jgi:hypothetical protein
MADEADTEILELNAALRRGEDPVRRDRLVQRLAELGRLDEAVVALARVTADLPERPKSWRTLTAILKALPDPEARAGVWGQALKVWAAMDDGGHHEAFGADLAQRLFSFLGEFIRRIDPADPASIDEAWQLAGAFYSEPLFGDLAASHPEAFKEFVRLCGTDPYIKNAERRGSDLSPCVPEAIRVRGVKSQQGRLRELYREEMAAEHGGLEAVSRRAQRLLADPEFHRPVIICGFHHSGTRLLARQLEALGVSQRINLYQYEWSYIVQINSILEPGCMAPARLGAGEEPANLVSAQSLAFRMTLAGLKPGQSWGFKDPRNGLTGEAWLKAFPGARVVHLLRDPVVAIGTLPELYDRFVRLDAERPSRARFWLDLWQAYVEGARRTLAASSAGIEIRFEDLCRDPIEVLGRTCSALDLAARPEPALLADAPIDAGKADLRDRARGALEESDFEALASVAAQYGY